MIYIGYTLTNLQAWQEMDSVKLVFYDPTNSETFTQMQEGKDFVQVWEVEDYSLFTTKKEATSYIKSMTSNTK